MTVCDDYPNGMVGPGWRRVLMNDRCVYCGGEPTGLDHIAAKSMGGSDGWLNRAPACESCDAEKGTATLVRFLLARRLAQHRLAHRKRYRYMDAKVREGARKNMVRSSLSASLAERLSASRTEIEKQ